MDIDKVARFLRYTTD